MKNNFLPKDFDIPVKSNGYMRLQEGDNKFRIFSQAITGWEYWTEEKDSDTGEMRRKPNRKRTDEEVPLQERYEMKFFMAFTVWNYQLNATEILQITQKGIQTALRSLNRSDSWGDPRDYDIVIHRKGKGLETEYTVQPEPKAGFEHKDKINKDIVLEALYEGADPFDYKARDIDAEAAEEILGK